MPKALNSFTPLILISIFLTGVGFSRFSLANIIDVPLTPEEIAINNCVHILKDTGLISFKEEFIYRYCETKLFTQKRKLGRLGLRIMAERATELNPFVITPHEVSYLMPVTITDNFHREPYQIYDLASVDGSSEDVNFSKEMSKVEAKYQVSFKVPLNEKHIFLKGDALYFGMTLQAWWQVYSNDLSSPFRETNYKPEVFYIAPLPWRISDGGLGFAISLEHQSNGQFQGLSRSWNRAHFTLIYDAENWSASVKMWHRFKEKQKEYLLDPDGDDNPDIEKYLGNHEVKLGYAFNDHHKVFTNIRKNLRTGNGSLELNYSFPFTGKLRGFAQYFTGYGESLIDYNHKQQKFGIGITLTDIF